MGSFTNQIKTVLLLGLLTAIMLWVGSIWGSQGLTIALVIVILMNIFTYFFSDKLVLAMYRARPVEKSHRLYGLVADVAKQAKIPIPKAYIIPNQISNAFACGRSPKHSSIAFTEGILGLLNRDELRGVAAHELSHVKNRDILIATVAATIAGVISYVGQMAQWGMIFGNNNDRQNGNIFGLIVLAIITPIVAMLIQLAISRSREYQADASGAEIIKNGKPLASALSKLENSAKLSSSRATPIAKATSYLFIVNPFSAKEVTALFMTHPPTSERIKRLNALRF